MRPIRRAAAMALFALIAARPASAAGKVEVSAVEPQRFVDFGTSTLETQRNLRSFTDHLIALGSKGLKDGQLLQVELLDVDLAGRVRPMARSGQDLRVVRDVDWPRIHLRYTLREGERVLSSGDEWLRDPGETFGSGRFRNQPLGAEKQLLQRWFEARFVDKTP